MKHDSDPMSDNSYDVHFIDSTLDHHAGVIVMAEQALKESTTVALKDLAQQTMTTTQKEIDWLKAYRAQNHPNAPQGSGVTGRTICAQLSVISDPSAYDLCLISRGERAWAEDLVAASDAKNNHQQQRRAGKL